jgi:hypothetical protein
MRLGTSKLVFAWADLADFNLKKVKLFELAWVSNVELLEKIK